MTKKRFNKYHFNIQMLQPSGKDYKIKQYDRMEK